MKKWAKLGLVVAIAALIFRFSSQTYEQQSLVPVLERLLPGQPFAGLFSHIKFFYGHSLVSIETKGYYHFVEFFIRKFAHLFLFGCLAVALFSVLTLARPRRLWPVMLIAVAATGVYAAVDEYHQLLTGGRTPMARDVLLDVTGAALFLAAYVPVYKWKQKKRAAQ